MKKPFVCLFIFTLACLPVWAGSGPDQKQIAEIQKKVVACLEHERRVTVETYDGRLFKGSVGEAEADEFVLVYNGRPTTLKYADVRKITWPSEVSRLAKAAIGVAAVVGCLFVALVLLGGLKG
ncbi:MAG: hypothetical protein WA673_14075 [Candidatus Acidiferrales bacterium]